jgi:hypothetical protein
MRDERQPLPAWVTGLILIGVVGALTVLAFFGIPQGGPSVRAPKSFKSFETPDKSVAGVGPSDWTKKRSTGLGGTIGGVAFAQGTAKINITADLAGSLMGDMAAAANAQISNVESVLPEGQAQALTKPPVEKLHEAGEADMEETFEGYTEQPMKPLQSALGDARISEFTGKTQKDMFSQGYPAHGYRATILGGEKRVTVLCYCSDKDWKNLKPAFDKVIGSLKQGSL